MRRVRFIRSVVNVQNLQHVARIGRKEKLEQRRKKMRFKQYILKGIIFVLLIVITIILDVFYIKVGKRLLWLICGYITYWIWEIEEKE